MKTLTLMLMTVAGAAAAESQGPGPRGQARLVKMVTHELLMLPFYGVFDNLSFSLDGYNVTLRGQVTRSTMKSDAENVVKRIEGVERVINQIEVLPLSNQDDQIRLAAARAIFGHPSLNQYSLRAVPPIHIIVKNGHVTLEGVVLNESDRTIAGIQANAISGVFSVTNNLRFEVPSKKK